ncbi:sensor histidine kinase [Streptomyces sp. NBC_01465]|uniref:sensor histidine kinase n=1 Tax=Streptomyces sp. NBC_01465 TaxID=2903878 RepID=UPI002E37E4BE|nr:HAMP domain-containing sensor histidine kinase [Streptomyces sp. NBC_01465]
MTLRRRLVLGVTLLAAAAVLAAQTIGFLTLRGWLLDRVDQQLITSVPAQLGLVEQMAAGGLPGLDTSDSLPSDFRLLIYDATNRTRATISTGDKPGPRLPESATDLNLRHGRPFTVPAVSGAGRWRVLLATAPSGAVFAVALPLDTVDGATSRLLWLNGTVLAATVLALLAAGAWVVRLGLRPLTRMERTAQDITAGDLDLRLVDTDPRTETGRLGQVLNTMLERLQGALLVRESSEARLRRFVADAGHELRTPLTTVQGFAELALLHDDLPKDQRDEANRLIAQNAERMALLIDDLLLLARLDEEPGYRAHPVDLALLAADTVSEAVVRQADHPVDLGPLGPDADAEVPSVPADGDPHRLRQILDNLLANALTHTPPGTPVHVRVGSIDGTSVVEVADEGPGLGAQDAERVFERFYRVDPARSRDHGGSGLGLAIAAAIAQGHGGRLELETRPGAGCTFRLLLPAIG